MKINTSKLIKILLFSPLFIKSLTKLVNLNFSTEIAINILVSLFIFVFIKNTAVGFANCFKLKISESLSIVFMFLFMFFISLVFTLLEFNLTFNIFVFINLIIFNIYYFFSNDKFKIIQVVNIILISSFNFFKLNHHNLFIQKRIEIAGDIYAHLLPITEQIFYLNIYDVFNNPLDVGTNFYILFSTIGNFYFAFLSKLFLFNTTFMHLKMLPYTLFWLFLLTTNELKFEKFYKVLFLVVNLCVFLINDWINYQFFNSNLNEGVIALFIYIIYSKYEKEFTQNKLLLKHLLLGVLLFSKFFTSILFFIIPFCFLALKKVSMKNVFSIFISPVFFIILYNKFGFANLRNYSNFKTETGLVEDILNYWFEDLILVYFTVLFIVFFLLNLKSLNTTIKIQLILNTINFFFIFFLYVFYWGYDYEFESSYRYFLQLYFINIYALFLLIIKFDIKEPRKKIKYII